MAENSEEKSKEGYVLKVAADPKSVDAKEKGRRAKALAGAMTHGIRVHGECCARALKPAAVWKAVKSHAIARGIAHQSGCDVLAAPAFMDADIGNGNFQTGIKFILFGSEGANSYNYKTKTTLRVKADSFNISDEDRKKSVIGLATVISETLKSEGSVRVRGFKDMAIYKAVKAIIIARGNIATQGYDMYEVPDFIVGEIDGRENTGFEFLCFVSKNEAEQ